MKKVHILLLILFPLYLTAQNTNTTKKLSFTGDFRFRVEQDWDSKKTDGSYREDRTRLRYRARFGFTYTHTNWVNFGMRLRTGAVNKQQDPQLTLGDGSKEFGTLPISFEKAFANFKYHWFSAWVGKNTFPFEKQNELFWSDNVFPEGVSLKGKFNFDSKFLQSLQINTGHFIVASQGTSLAKDRYFEAFQLVSTHWQNRLKFFPSFYYFKNMPNIPDGSETFVMDYKILHLGTQLLLNQSPKIVAGFDFYHNLEDLDSNNAIESVYKNQKKGYVSSIGLGQLKKKGDWKLQFTHSYLERFAAVDFFAQNDWARWDYSSDASPDGRLTNFKGLEIMTGYALSKNTNIKMRCFNVSQIKTLGTTQETGNRIRVDFNIGF
ncbi:putative porin [Flavicella sediminum]|uniref:putative porin n=1 Tax=Flavicella sediminum TaxID=2585141 RepID=UPI00140A83D6|nr:putative porin [Flavicella sediminum]